MAKPKRTLPPEILGTEIRTLRCELTPDEVADKASTAASAAAVILSKKRERKEFAAASKLAVDELELIQAKALDCVRTGAEDRKVDCIRRRMPGSNTVEIVRLDTGEVLLARRAFDDELQGSLVGVSLGEEVARELSTALGEKVAE